MASTCTAVAIITPATVVTQPRQQRISTSLLRLPSPNHGLEMQASFSTNKNKMVSVATAAAMAVALAVPDVANAADPGLSPSLKNFLLSIGAGGLVLTVIIGVVIGVSNFDPVKRD